MPTIRPGYNNLMAEPGYPITEIKWVLYACRADEPLPPDDPRRHDFTALRGGSSVVTDLVDTLEQALPDGRFHHRLLCGHRGSGKSTELLCLKQWADENDFLTVWVEVDLYFGLADLQFSDLYLLAAQSVATAMLAYGSPLPDRKLEKVIEWFASVTEEDVERVKSELSVEAGAEVSTPPFASILGKLFAKFSAGVKAGSEHQIQTRQTLRQAPDFLIDLTNDLLRTANEQLAAKCPNGLLLLFDNLDRFETETIERLLMRGSTLVRKMDCHAVFTMPINLQYNKDTGTYWDDFGPPAILPMLALRTPGDRWAKTVADSPFNEAAVDEVLAALNKRLDVNRLFEHPEDARLLVRMSGGCMRDLLHLATLTRQKSRTNPTTPVTHLTSSGVRRAVTEYRTLLTEGLGPEDYKRLARIAGREPEADTLDAHALQLLSRRVALRYPRDGERWTDVHPLVIETEGFQRAVTAGSSIVPG